MHGMRDTQPLQSSPWFDRKGDPVCPWLLAFLHSLGEYVAVPPKECWNIKSAKNPEK